ncbi:hypothetical protein HYALB_00001371 [Hymenoscyphus albidus]|uniref:Uncharacterized protein n=1 Tax=Hymenoscyphus albidus TaxID=595503 RepID=A0A9N9LK17_9HELO|nr:hypothetical protein HYALB_00001371 [Hymenoscyphus albidus]
MSTPSSTPASQSTNTQTPLQIAEAKMKAAGSKQLEIRYRNWVLAQPKLNEVRQDMKDIYEHMRPLITKYNKAVDEKDEASAKEAGKEIYHLELHLDHLNQLVNESIPEQNWKEEYDADQEILNAFEEISALKKSST